MKEAYARTKRVWREKRRHSMNKGDIARMSETWQERRRHGENKGGMA